jgi:hypothetical protein
MCNYFRTLRADEIEVRVQQVKPAKKSDKVYAQLLLYKNARVDMTLLDEVFGIFGWQREHTFKDGKNYCKVSVYDVEHRTWVAKEDVGTEGDIEKDKSQASSAFKRACTNLGLGRELYSSPTLFVSLNNGEYWQDGTDKHGNPKYKLTAGVTFDVNAIAYDERRNIVAIRVVDSYGRTRIEKGELHDALYMATAEANSARTERDAINVWNKYPEFQYDAQFVCACKAKANGLID